MDKKKQLNFYFAYVGKVKRGAFAAGRKITRIISFSKKKSPRPGDPRISYSDPRQGQTPLQCQSSLGLGRCKKYYYTEFHNKRLDEK